MSNCEQNKISEEAQVRLTQGKRYAFYAIAFIAWGLQPWFRLSGDTGTNPVAICFGVVVMIVAAYFYQTGRLKARIDNKYT